ncbi:hypothetical protein HOY80DRAFT_882688 [Tuber brumale]|nr:hypothetical protein HOY80DRAFT_882688 [Tuber brumale]
MSSNVGLSTPRGSGTSGYVQRNLSHLRPRDYPPPSSSSAIASNTREYRQREPDKEILEHDRKRGVEVKCLEFRDKLEDEGIDEDEIDERVETYRKELLEELEREGDPHQVHEIAVAKAAESERLRNALGISKDYREGSHWKKQEDERQKRLEDREKEIAASRRRSASPA